MLRVRLPAGVLADVALLDFDSREAPIQVNHVASGTVYLSSVTFRNAIGGSVVEVDSNSDILDTGVPGGRAAFENCTFQDIELDEATGGIRGANVVLAGVQPMAFSDGDLQVFDGSKLVNIEGTLEDAAQLVPPFLSLQDAWLADTIAVRR